MACRIDEQGFSPECFGTVLDTMAEAVLIVDTDGVVQYCNPAMARMAGTEEAAILGRSCGDIMVCACSTPAACGLFEAGRLDNLECQVRGAGGTRVPVLKNGRVLRDEGGTVIGGVETLTDITTLKRAQGRLAELEETVFSRSRFGRIIGRSRAINDVLKLVDLASASNANVLIEGETGTGKELIAEAIHAGGGRAEGPLVKVNCSALPENLLESELFGHARGAFTGAVQDRQGRFERADGGTLFLDEVGEVAPLIQVKLLRFLQEREFERVGESSTRKADVRIVAATHRNLRALVASGEFREDLYYRLKVFPIHVPSLRDHKEDIGQLVDHFIAKYRAETTRPITGLSRDAAITMMDYCWPGNVRELENAVEHAFVTCQGGEIGLFDLPLEIRKVELRSGICLPSVGETSRIPEPRAYASSPREISPEDLVALLDTYQWNKTRVAQHLGVDRTTVWRKMKQFGMALTPKA